MTLRLYVDAVRLIQILSNLVSNAGEIYGRQRRGAIGRDDDATNLS